MKKTILLSCVVVFLSTYSPAMANEKTVKEIKAVLVDMISLLESGKHRRFMEKYMPPKMKQEIKKSGQFDSVVKRFKEGNADDLLDHLKKAVKMTPAVENPKSCKYSGTPLRKPLVFKKEKGKWYLAN